MRATTTKSGPNDAVNFSEGKFVQGIDPSGQPESLRAAVAAGSATLPGFAIPPYNYIGITYYGSTNNPHVVTYKTGGSGGTTVATLTLTYVGSGAADDDKVATVTKS